MHPYSWKRKAGGKKELIERPEEIKQDVAKESLNLSNEIKQEFIPLTFADVSFDFFYEREDKVYAFLINSSHDETVFDIFNNRVEDIKNRLEKKKNSNPSEENVKKIDRLLFLLNVEIEYLSEFKYFRLADTLIEQIPYDIDGTADFRSLIGLYIKIFNYQNRFISREFMGEIFKIEFTPEFIEIVEEAMRIEETMRIEKAMRIKRSAQGQQSELSEKPASKNENSQATAVEGVSSSFSSPLSAPSGGAAAVNAAVASSSSSSSSATAVATGHGASPPTKEPPRQTR